MSIKQKFLDLLYPEGITCSFCDNDVFENNEYQTCIECKDELPFIHGDICKRCGTKLFSMATYCNRCQSNKYSFTKARAVFYYKDKIAAAIKNLKFNNAVYLTNPLSRYMADLYFKEFDCDILVPVPMYSENLKKRGYNQAELLANSLGKIINKEVNTKDLIKINKTKSQADLDFNERQNNLTKAFKVVNKNVFKGKKVLIVDDIFTTGATVENCAKALLKAGALKVYAITIAHTLLQ